MRVADKVVLLWNDPDGFGAAIAGALDPNPNFSLRRLEETIELPLDNYGIENGRACGKIVHFVDGNGVYKVSVLLLQSCDSPRVACAMHKLLDQITGETSTLPTVLAPFLVAASKLRTHNRSLAASSKKACLYCVQTGPETEISRLFASQVQKAPSSLQLHYEPLSCFLHLARALKLPTFVLIGQRSTSLSDKALGEELQVIYEMGELVASSTGLRFLRDKIKWNQSKTLKEDEKPWRALYG